MKDIMYFRLIFVFLLLMTSGRSVFACVEVAPFYLESAYSRDVSNIQDLAARQKLAFKNQVDRIYARLGPLGITEKDACLLELTSNLITQLDAPRPVLIDLLGELGISSQAFHEYSSRINKILTDATQNSGATVINDEDVIGAIVSTIMLGKLRASSDDLLPSLRALIKKLESKQRLSVQSRLAMNLAIMYELLERQSWNRVSESPVLINSTFTVLSIFVEIQNSIKAGFKFDAGPLCDDFKDRKDRPTNVAISRQHVSAVRLGSPYLSQLIRVFNGILLGEKSRKVKLNLPDELGSAFLYFDTNNFSSGISGKIVNNIEYCKSGVMDLAQKEYVESLVDRRMRFIEYFRMTGDRYFENTNFSFSLAATNLLLDLERENDQLPAARTAFIPLLQGRDKQASSCRDTELKRINILDFLDASDSKIQGLDQYLNTAHGKSRLIKYKLDFFRSGFEDVVAPNPNCFLASSPSEDGRIVDQKSELYHVGSLGSNAYFDPSNGSVSRSLKVKLESFADKLSSINGLLIQHLGSLKADKAQAYFPELSSESLARERYQWADAILRNIHYRGSVVGLVHSDLKEAVIRRHAVYSDGLMQVEKLKVHLADLPPSLLTAQEFALLRLPYLETQAYIELENIRRTKFVDSKDGFKHSLKYIEANPINFAYVAEVMAVGRRYSTGWGRLQARVSGFYDSFGSFLESADGQAALSSFRNSIRTGRNGLIGALDKHARLAKLATLQCFGEQPDEICENVGSVPYTPSLGHYRDGFSGKCRGELLSIISKEKVGTLSIPSLRAFNLEKGGLYATIDSERDEKLNSVLKQPVEALNRDIVQFLMFNNQTDVSKLGCALPSHGLKSVSLVLYAFSGKSKARYFDTDYHLVKSYEPYSSEVGYIALGNLLQKFSETVKP